MITIQRVLAWCTFVFAGVTTFYGQQPLQMASLRASQPLLLRRVSPTTRQLDGPVLYQLVFRSSATPNHIPRISNTFTLTNSLLSDDGSQVAIGGLAISGTGVISFANGQTFPGVVNGISAGDGSITIGGSSSAPTVRVATNGIGNANIADFSLSPAKIAGQAAILGGSNSFSGSQFISGNGSTMSIGDVGCSSGFIGIDLSYSLQGCSGYTLVGNFFGTYVNRVQGGRLALREGNVDQLSIDPGGTVHVWGTLTKGGGSFMIDHPLDPANKYLYHSFVESPDMMNIYNGIAALDGSGEAVVTLPDWFGALNRDFRYQLTAIGAPGPNLYIASEIANNRFKIAGGQPGAKVSWQVTGIRQDAYANAHRIPVEEDKPAAEKGTYLHPELFGASPEKSLSALHGPQAVRSTK